MVILIYLMGILATYLYFYIDLKLYKSEDEIVQLFLERDPDNNQAFDFITDRTLFLFIMVFVFVGSLFFPLLIANNIYYHIKKWL